MNREEEEEEELTCVFLLFAVFFSDEGDTPRSDRSLRLVGCVVVLGIGESVSTGMSALGT